MLKRFLTFLAVILMPFVAVEAQDYSWESVPVDGRMTGCTSTSGDNVAEALGYFKVVRQSIRVKPPKASPKRVRFATI